MVPDDEGCRDGAAKSNRADSHQLQRKPSWKGERTSLPMRTVLIAMFDLQPLHSDLLENEGQLAVVFGAETGQGPLDVPRTCHSWHTPHDA